MRQKPGTTTVEVRSLADEAERAAYFQLNARIFRESEDIESVADTRRRFITGMPTFHPVQLRGAFLDGQFVGGYMHLKRFLNIEEISLSTGCISGVCTDPDFRQRGVATALMRNALEFASQQEQHLLLLHGIPDFYHRFGFVDACEDMVEYLFKREQIAAQPASSYRVRPLTRADAPAILRLYQEQQGSSPVSFVRSRTLDAQEHLLFNWFEVYEGSSVVAVSPANKLEGYLLLSRRQSGVYAYEVAAGSWLAALALLHHQNNLLASEPEQHEQFAWPVAPYTPLAYLLADSLPLTLSTYSIPDSGWMARPLHLEDGLKSCQPLLQRRWQFGHIPWAGAFLWQIGQEYWRVELTASGRLSLIPTVEGTSSGLPFARLSLQAFTQLLFGFRSITYLARQPGNVISQELLSVFSTLFPARQAWIAVSDFF